ncbi:response regulator transcription factor [Curtobacterium sp. A7_M15]|uniref:response regulator n=1 Tax=Curtobacterium sp. A7_M15 TaxID=3065241 RepID=UPI002737DB67|nr:response regulator transcription factor [Curtobacterium sp. A7_M15]MDP4334714.1 response regulator transcription factor [Curtobacterium sp. A7_M15]
MIRVAIVDDQQLIRTGFRLLLDAQPDIEVVGEAEDGAAGVQLARAHHPDVVLMDVRMPRVDGVTATAAIVEQLPDTRVIVLTTFDLDEYAFGGLRAGASGFLLKDISSAQLLDAIRAVAVGEAVVSPRVTQRMLDLFGTKLPDRGDGGPDAAAALTPRERDVLLAMARGLSNQEIASSLHTSESTVKTHVGRVLAKLGLRDRVHAVIFAYEHGLAR